MMFVQRLKDAFNSHVSRQIMDLVLRSPAVLLADLWYRGISDDNVYGLVAQRLTTVGLLNKSWPISPVDFIRPWLFIVSLWLLFASDPRPIYKFVRCFLLRQLCFVALQRYIDAIHFDNNPELDNSQSHYCLDVSHCPVNSSLTCPLTQFPQASVAPPTGFQRLSLVVMQAIVTSVAAVCWYDWNVNTIGRNMFSMALNSLDINLSRLYILVRVQCQDGTLRELDINVFGDLVVAVHRYVKHLFEAVQSVWLMFNSLGMFLIPGYLLTMLLPTLPVAEAYISTVNVLVCWLNVVYDLITWFGLSVAFYVMWFLVVPFYFTPVYDTVRQLRRLVSWITFNLFVLLTLFSLSPPGHVAATSPTDQLLSLFAETTSSPFAFVGLCSLVSLFSQVVWRLSFAWLNWTLSPVDVVVTGLTDSQATLAIGFVMYLLGVRCSPLSIGVLLLVVLTTVQTRRVLVLAEFVLLSPERRQYPRRLRALVVYMFLVFFPLLATYETYVKYGPADWTFITIAPSLLATLTACMSLVKWLVYVIDEWTLGAHFEDVNETIELIERWTQIIRWFISGSIILTAVVAIFNSDHSLWSLLLIVVYFEIHIRPPYISMCEVNARRHQLAAIVTALPSPSADDHRLGDVCPICYVDLCPGDSRSSQQATTCVLTPCQHVYHRRCLTKWVAVLANCPTCRRDLSVDSQHVDANLSSNVEPRRHVRPNRHVRVRARVRVSTLRSARTLRTFHVVKDRPVGRSMKVGRLKRNFLSTRSQPVRRRLRIKPKLTGFGHRRLRTVHD